jgi:hypothetical protein
MNQEDIIRMAREVGLWPAVTDNFSKELVALAAKELEAFAKLVAAAERADMRKGFAGVTLWLGAGEVTQLVTETQIKYERNQGDALTEAAQRCLDIYAGARGETK